MATDLLHKKEKTIHANYYKNIKIAKPIQLNSSLEKIYCLQGSDYFTKGNKQKSFMKWRGDLDY